MTVDQCSVEDDLRGPWAGLRNPISRQFPGEPQTSIAAYAVRAQIATVSDDPCGGRLLWRNSGAGRVGWRRSVPCEYAEELDDLHFQRFPLPFILGHPNELLIYATDDSEFSGVAAMILLEIDSDYTPRRCSPSNRNNVVQAGDDSGPALLSGPRLWQSIRLLTVLSQGS